jgi:hypothetical protein
MFPGVALLQLLLAAFLCGLIWLIQTVHYPLFRNVGLVEFAGYHRNHVASIKYIVIPAMLAEVVCALALPLMAPTLWSNPLYLTSLVALAVVWVSTWLIQGPLHSTLRMEFSYYEHRLLVRTNWLRTIAWSVRLITLTTLFLQWLPRR